MTRGLAAALALAAMSALAVEPAEACKKHQAKGPCETKEFDFDSSPLSGPS